MTVRPLTADSVAVKFPAVVPPFPSLIATSLTDTVGSGSLSLIVPRPVPDWMMPLTGFDRTTRKSSLFSSRVSPTTGTVTVASVFLLTVTDPVRNV